MESPPPSSSPGLTPVSRRTFLNTGLGLGALALLPGGRAALAADHAADDATALPGVLFDHAELPRIRDTMARPEFAAYRMELQLADLDADRRFLTQDIDLLNRVSDLARVGTIALRSAFAHLIEPDPTQLEIARLAIATALKFNRWDWILEDDTHTVGVMRAPSIGVQLICAQDWLGEDLDPAVRAALRRRIAEEVGPACHRAVAGELGASPMPAWSMDPDTTGLNRLDVSQWPRILAGSNLQIIATAGLVAAACWVPEHPDADAWCELGVRSLREFSAEQPTDGSFEEGSAYWGFTYNYFIVSLEMLRRLRGIDERGIADFPAMSRYLLSTTMPTAGHPQDCISIGDCNRFGSTIPFAWIAREFRDSTSQHLLTRAGLARVEPISCWAAIWFDPSVPRTISVDIPLDRRAAPGLVFSRSGWTENDSVLCLRSGDPCNHEHADRNSLLFAAYGERLFNDPLKASYATSDPKWLLRQTEAHSAVLINGQGHIYHHGEEGTNASTARAEVLTHQVGLDWMTATSDATDAYRQAGLPVSRVTRTVVFVKPGIVVCLDAVDLTTPQSVEVRFQVYNDDGEGRVTAAGSTFAIARPRAGLLAKVGALDPVTVTAGRLALPADAGVYPFAAVHSAVSQSHRILTVATAHPTAAIPDDLNWKVVDGHWSISGTQVGKPISISVIERPGAAAPAVVV
ncbi:heparinase II/III domain-containing protein [Synoicihabitans lomoniglobus]|uniref:Heparinase II/III family protein n=1 Tax=Synoicihabitans lomoniglobus TaxID=2909285 RepID=A0AAE9ZZJ2_9BACT|nr:heparinase II/III-family protein [Opitutaceae bacterium LMO-M01]WED63472.1 heparinase II/III family protein [Opitutaceae bacterium LMO-M01]